MHRAFPVCILVASALFAQTPALRVAVVEGSFPAADGRTPRLASTLAAAGVEPRALYPDVSKGRLDVARTDVLLFGSFLHYAPGAWTATLVREQAKLRSLLEGGAVIVVFPQAHGRNVAPLDLLPDLKTEEARRIWSWLGPEAPTHWGPQGWDSLVDLESDHPLVSIPHKIGADRIVAAKTRQATQTDTPIGLPGGRFILGHRYKLAAPWLAEYVVGRGRVLIVGGAIDQLEAGHVEASELLADLTDNILAYAQALKSKKPPPFVPTFKAMPASTSEAVFGYDDWKGFEARVDAAVERGVAFLKKSQKPDGSFGKFTAPWGPDDYSVGQTCLSVMALLASGVSKHDPEIKRALAWLPTRAPEDTYQAGCLAYALEHKSAPDGERHAFHKLSPAARAKFEFDRRPTPAERKTLEECVAWLLKSRHRGFWRYLEDPKDADLSASQFAALGLLAAQRCSIPVPREAFERMADGLLGTIVKGKDRTFAIPRGVFGPHETPSFEESSRQVGFWNYYAPARAAWGRGTTDAIGIAMLAIAHDGLSTAGAADHRGPKIAQAIGFAVNHLDLIFRVDIQPVDAGRPFDSFPDFYFLYTLERAMTLTETRFIGRHDWYREAAEMLLDVQRSGGRWDVAGSQHRSDVLHTAFALLTLRRATFPSRTTPR